MMTLPSSGLSEASMNKLQVCPSSPKNLPNKLPDCMWEREREGRMARGRERKKGEEEASCQRNSSQRLRGDRDRASEVQEGPK